MSNKLTKAAPILAILAIVISIVGFVAISRSKGPSQTFSGTSSMTSMPIENYVPVVQYNGGLYTLLPVQASSTLDVTGVFTSYATNTCRTITNGSICYETKGGLDIATVQVSLSATSSVPGVIPNPFGTATSTVTGVLGEITSGPIGTNTNRFYLSTTTAAGGYGSSTPAFASMVNVNGEKQLFSWESPGVSTTTPSDQGSDGGVQQILAVNPRTGTFPKFTVGPNEFLTFRTATTSPGTFAGGYYSGTISAVFIKP